MIGQQLPNTRLPLARWSPLSELRPLGAGLYTTAALFNHSCDPNIVRCNVGRVMVR